MRTVWMTAAILLASGCYHDDGDIFDSEQQEIIGGTTIQSLESDYWKSVALIPGCTGTLIAPHVILTAAHCAEEEVRGTATFGINSSEYYDKVSIVDSVHHRQYTGFAAKDVALLRLSEPPNDPAVQPMAFNRQPLDQSWVGREITTVGFGDTDGANHTGFGRKRYVDYNIDGVTAEHLLVGTQTANTCQGDSGGPTFAYIDGVPTVMAVTSFGSFECLGQSSVARVDVSLDGFVLEVLAAWDGPCRQGDGMCGEGCEYPDPDCNICGYDGVCGQNCERPDLDCPVGAQVGQVCQDKYDCETRLCTEAPDDPRVKFCTEPCDPGGDFTCDAPTARCAANGSDGNVCLFGGASVSAQGAQCLNNDECRSGICDAGNRICVEQCGDGQPECAAPYECQGAGNVDICTLPGDGGGCSAGDSRDRSNQALALLLLGALFALRRRRQMNDSR